MAQFLQLHLLTQPLGGAPHQQTIRPLVPLALALLLLVSRRLRKNMNWMMISVGTGTRMQWCMMPSPPPLINLTTLLPFTYLATTLLLHTLTCWLLQSASQFLWLLLWLLQLTSQSLWLLLWLISSLLQTAGYHCSDVKKLHHHWFLLLFLCGGHGSNQSYVPQQDGFHFIQGYFQPTSLDG
jgi:hypothetical protein